jgi:ribosomal-protein-alanine N-acetyltransferase
MSAARIRRIETSHIADLIRIAEATNLNQWTAAHYLDELKNSQSIMLRVESDVNATLGFIVGRLVPATDSNIAVDAEIYNIGVDPGRQRTGCGRALVDEFFRICRERIVRSVWLEVRENNAAAIALYKKFGFAAVTIRKDFYRDPRENGILMRCDLDS